MNQRYARVVDGVVSEIWVSPGEDLTPADAFHPDYPGEWVPCGAAVDQGYRCEDGTFEPPPPTVQPAPRQFSFLAFMDLFTDAEQLAIAGAAMTDAPTKLWYDRAVGAQFISLDDSRLTAGLDAMVAAGLLTAERGERVLQGLPPEA